VLHKEIRNIVHPFFGQNVPPARRQLLDVELEIGWGHWEVGLVKLLHVHEADAGVAAGKRGMECSLMEE
jgi:hypothetical protein